MTEKQLNALRHYIDVITQFLIDRSLSREIYIEQWQVDSFERKFTETMLASETPEPGEQT